MSTPSLHIWKMFKMPPHPLTKYFARHWYIKCHFGSTCSSLSSVKAFYFLQASFNFNMYSFHLHMFPLLISGANWSNGATTSFFHHHHPQHNFFLSVHSTASIYLFHPHHAQSVSLCVCVCMSAVDVKKAPHTESQQHCWCVCVCVCCSKFTQQTTAKLVSLLTLDFTYHIKNY